MNRLPSLPPEIKYIFFKELSVPSFVKFCRTDKKNNQQLNSIFEDAKKHEGCFIKDSPLNFIKAAQISLGLDTFKTTLSANNLFKYIFLNEFLSGNQIDNFNTPRLKEIINQSFINKATEADLSMHILQFNQLAEKLMSQASFINKTTETDLSMHKLQLNQHTEELMSQVSFNQSFHAKDSIQFWHKNDFDELFARTSVQKYLDAAPEEKTEFFVSIAKETLQMVDQDNPDLTLNFIVTMYKALFESYLSVCLKAIANKGSNSLSAEDYKKNILESKETNILKMFEMYLIIASAQNPDYKYKPFSQRLDELTPQIQEAIDASKNNDKMDIDTTPPITLDTQMKLMQSLMNIDT